MFNVMSCMTPSRGPQTSRAARGRPMQILGRGVADKPYAYDQNCSLDVMSVVIPYILESEVIPRNLLREWSAVTPNRIGSRRAADVGLTGCI